MSTSGAERSRRPIEATPQKLLGNKIRDMVIPVKKMNEIREIGKMWARQVSGTYIAPTLEYGKSVCKKVLQSPTVDQKRDYVTNSKDGVAAVSEESTELSFS